MAFVNVRVVGGALDDSEKQRMIKDITDLVVDIEGKGDPTFGQYCRVIVDEMAPGMLGVGGGKGLSTEDVVQAQGGS